LFNKNKNAIKEFILVIGISGSLEDCETASISNSFVNTVLSADALILNENSI